MAEKAQNKDVNINLCALDEDALFHIAKFLELSDVQNLGYSCSFFYSICCNPNAIEYINFYRDVLIAKDPLTHNKFSKVRHLKFYEWFDNQVQPDEMNDYFKEHIEKLTKSGHDLLRRAHFPPCFDIFRAVIIDNKSILKKLFNANWKVSLYKLTLSCDNNFFPQYIEQFLPKQFENIQHLVLDHKTETDLIQRTVKSKSLISCKFFVPLSTPITYFSNFFKSILDAEHLQHLSIRGCGALNISKYAVQKLDVFVSSLKTETRQLRHLKSICLTQMDECSANYLFYEYLVANTICNELVLTMEPGWRSSFDLLKKLLLSPHFKMEKISSLTMVLNLEVMGILLKRLRKCETHQLKKICFTMHNTEEKDTKDRLLVENLIELIRKYCTESFSLKIHSRHEIDHIVTFWQSFASLICKQQHVLENGANEKIKRLEIVYLIGMFGSHVTSCQKIRSVAELFNKELYSSNAIHFIKNNLCETVNVMVDLSSFKEDETEMFDALVEDLDKQFDFDIKRGINGGAFLFEF